MSEEPRTPPQRVRVTKLQEAQLGELEVIESHCVGMHHQAGMGADAIKARVQAEIAGLARDHDVLVAEADHLPAAYLVWADQAPGVAFIEWIAVHPEYQRFGIGTRLLREVGEKAVAHGIKVAVVAAFDTPWSFAFLNARGFQPKSDKLPDALVAWCAQHEADLLTSGRKIWWAHSDGLGTIPGLPRP